MERIEVEAFLHTLTTGITAPSLVLCSDGEKYILKKQREKDNYFDSMFLNEVLSYKLADYLGIPTPECAIATIDEDLINMDRAIIFVHKFKEGMFFASKEQDSLINNVMDNVEELKNMGKPYIKRTWNDFFRDVEDKETFSKIIAFDLLIANFDRFNNQGNFLVTNENNINEFKAIDHGHAFFGPVWHSEKMKFLDGYSQIEKFHLKMIEMYIETAGPASNLGVVFKGIEQNVNLTSINNHDFQNIISSIETLDEKIIKSFFEDIPDEWFVDKDVQIEYYINFLLNHKDNVRYMVQILAELGYFTNYKGGRLMWIEKEEQDITQL